MASHSVHTSFLSPPDPGSIEYTSASEAVDQLSRLYSEATEFLREKIYAAATGKFSQNFHRAYYPEIRFSVNSHATIDSRLSFGHVFCPGNYSTTVTRPELFRDYLDMQIGLLMKNHGVPVTINVSKTPIPVHFALEHDDDSSLRLDALDLPLRDIFDVPDLTMMNDDIVNGHAPLNSDGTMPLAPFAAQRIDYSLARLKHYTATSPEHFQNFVLFTNYQFYVKGFVSYGRRMLADPNSSYTELVGPGDTQMSNSSADVSEPSLLPQMPAYHLKCPDGNGITLVNIGIGPSNAKTATDHIAVLRPRAWLMVGHCAGLRNGQRLGDYVLAHAYLREDQVLDKDLPDWVPIPPLAEIQVALENAVAAITENSGFELKRLMRTGTVASVDNRNWELRAHSGPLRRLNQSRAIALDMESATIAANGFRFRVPYGTLLCVSDKPLHGELKLPGMANRFYRDQVDKHLRIGIQAMESLSRMPMEFLQSRKLRSFDETAFL